ncbi:MAG: Slp family lipoprotein [Candidatus Rokubacteria bacterium]|nr:Slp family lipoprotein [Candidatus Rokubacteria bacterium]
MRRAGLLLSALLLAGCVSAFPDEMLHAVNRAVTVSELRRAPGAHTGARVILGGEILATRPRVGETEIEVLARNLGSDDSPDRSDRSEGRFLVTTRGFLDPAVYAAGRRITVVGTVKGEEERAIGELPYRYPVITAEQIKLWPRDVAARHLVPVYPLGSYDWPPWPYWPYGPYQPWPFR